MTGPGEGWGDEWETVADVVVVGTGVAGMTAAVAAASRGASVVVLERGAFTGGTTAKSGGVLWIPNNPLMRERGLVDDRADALRYLARTAYPTLYNPEHETLGLPEDKHALLAAFYDRGSVAIEELIALGALSLESVDYPDYYADLPEDTAPNGRAIQPVFPAGWRRGIDPTGGQLLVDQLQAAAERLGAKVLLEHRAAHLVRNDQLDVIGLEVQVGRRTELFGARRGVIFCSGGFLHNKRLALEFLRGPVMGGAAAEGSRGDFVDIGIEAGAQLGNMSHAWWDQVVAELAVRVPETVKDVYEPFGDSMVIVDRRGQRVVNEKIPYNERAQVHFAWDPVRREYPNLLLFMIWDEAVATNPDPTRFRFPVPPPGERYDFVITAPTFEALADELAQRLEKLAPWTGGFQLDPSFAAGLAATVERFDAMADDGRDLDFRRGETPIEEVWAGAPRPGASTAALHRFAPEGPYHCVILGAGALDTKGGPVIDSSARVLAPSGEPIVGLYGAGNCIASPAGQAYWGAGGTIGLALTYGFIAGCEATAAPAHSPIDGDTTVDALDLIEVHQLLSQYGHIVDARDWERFDELFLPDAVLDYTGVRAPAPLYGLEAIKDYFRDANHPSAHHVTNIVVTEQAGEVRVHSKFLAPYTRSSHDPRRWYGGDYEDLVARTPEGWRFARRTCAARWLLTPELAGGDAIPEHRRTW